MLGTAREDVDESSLRIDVVELRDLDQRLDVGGALLSAIAAVDQNISVLHAARAGPPCPKKLSRCTSGRMMLPAMIRRPKRNSENSKSSNTNSNKRLPKLCTRMSGAVVNPRSLA
jgi:hypothetical protein